MSELIPDAGRERKLLEIRAQAAREGKIDGGGIRVSGAPFPIASPDTGYYGIPLLKEPSWTWEVPLYFFVGGAAASAAIVGSVAHYTGASRKLVRDARWIAVAGSVLSPPLLIADLGRPERFINMLRVFKPQSPMSVGSWVLAGFSGGAAAAAFADLVQEKYGASLPMRILENAGQMASLAFGLPFSNYTGVLIGATAIPTWNEHAGELPVHFGISGLSAAVGLLELMGNHKSRALQALGLGAAAFECYEGWRIESQQTQANRPLKYGMSGGIVRAGGALSGPVPLALRTLSILTDSRKLRRAASISAVAGSLLTRIGWIVAGHASARDWRAPLEIPGTTQ